MGESSEAVIVTMLGWFLTFIRSLHKGTMAVAYRIVDNNKALRAPRYGHERFGVEGAVGGARRDNHNRVGNVCDNARCNCAALEEMRY